MKVEDSFDYNIFAMLRVLRFAFATDNKTTDDFEVWLHMNLPMIGAAFLAQVESHIGLKEAISIVEEQMQSILK